MDSSELSKGRIITAFRVFFKEPVDVYDNMLIWGNCADAERIREGNKVPELYKVYHKKINDKLKYYLNEQGFAIEAIFISDWIVYSEIEKKIVKMLLNMNRLKQQIMSHTKKTVSCWSIEISNDRFRIVNISFKRKFGFKKIRNKITLADFFEDYSFSIAIKETNPFSRQFSVRFKRKIFERDNFTCRYCNWKNGISGKEDRILTLDHIIPIAHGGTSKEENIATCCLQCNISKSDKILGYLYEKVFKDKQNKEDLNLNISD